MKINWQRLGLILGVIATAMTIGAHLYNDVQENTTRIKVEAAKEATQQIEKNNYHLRVEARFETIEKDNTNLKKAIRELEIKNHITPKF